MIITKKFNELSTMELYNILKLRNEVFVVEQNCVYNDTDDKDLDCTHIMYMENHVLLGYTRALKAGVSFDNPSIGRVVVSPSARHRGIAKEIMQFSIDYILNEYKARAITISAQQYLTKFYSDLGFVQVSEMYLEDNIPHVEMDYTL